MAHVLVLLGLSARGAHGVSQAGQDETLDDIFHAIKVAAMGYYVEFGFNGVSFEDSTGANTEELWRRGWRGLLLDGRNSNASINLHTAWIDGATIVNTFRKHNVAVYARSREA